MYLMALWVITFSTSNHMSGKAIWDKLPQCILENIEIHRVKSGQLQNCEGNLSPKLPELNMW